MAISRGFLGERFIPPSLWIIRPSFCINVVWESLVGCLSFEKMAILEIGLSNQHTIMAKGKEPLFAQATGVVESLEENFTST